MTNFETDWNNWIEIDYEEYSECYTRDTLLILDRGNERYWKIKEKGWGA
jgi:hypothetical protein